jgi:hypothetical protein
MPFAIGQLLRGQNRFLGFLGVLVDVHFSFQFPVSSFQFPVPSFRFPAASC